LFSGGPVSLFVVCDGHGGSRASDFAVDSILEIFRARLARGGEVVQALWKTVADVDAHFLAQVGRKQAPETPRLLSQEELDGERPQTARSQSQVSTARGGLSSRGSGAGSAVGLAVEQGSGAISISGSGSLNRSRSQPDVLTGRKGSLRGDDEFEQALSRAEEHQGVEGGNAGTGTGTGSGSGTDFDGEGGDTMAVDESDLFAGGLSAIRNRKGPNFSLRLDLKTGIEPKHSRIKAQRVPDHGIGGAAADDDAEAEPKWLGSGGSGSAAASDESHL